jgi:1,4-dihydroxy-2-naphthoate octaprenyltransferase
LLLPVALVAAGAAVGLTVGSFDLLATLLALVGLVALHVAVNALNEASDFETGIDLETEPTPFSGGSKTLPHEDITPTAARRLGWAAVAVGVAVGAYFLVTVGWVLVPVYVVGAATVLAYTTVLTRYGVGELGAGLGLGALPVVGTVLVQGGSVPPATWPVSVAAFAATFNLLLLNEFPDELADRAGGRRNLVHRLGRPRAGQLYVAVVALAPLALAVGVLVGQLPAIALLGVVPTVLLARPVSWALTRPTAAVSTDALRENVIWVLATNLLVAAGLLVAVDAPPAVLVDPALAQQVARVVIGLGFLVLTLNNVFNLEDVAAMITHKGVAFPRLVILGASVPMLAASVAVLVGVCIQPAAAYIAVFLVGSTVVFHNFWSVPADEADNEAFHFFKNLVLLGITLLLFGFAAPLTTVPVGVC